MPGSNFSTPELYNYNTGLGSCQETEALKGALPIAQVTPQRPAYGLYTEKLSGSAFTAVRGENQQSWLYRIIPASAHAPLEPENDENSEELGAVSRLHYTPSQIQWDPFDFDEGADWVHGLKPLAVVGDASTRSGASYIVYSAGVSMNSKSAYYSVDGELLIIPQQGALDIRTELGRLLVRPHEICVIPRGIRYNVSLPHGPVRGYVVELHQGTFVLPYFGPIGSFGLANARDFQIPLASFDNDIIHDYTIISKFNGGLFKATQDHTPFDFVAWHGLYYPYKYDLGRYLTIGSICYDHPDPSIFTFLTTPDNIVEMAIFPPPWLVMEDTFRPPWYHRNVMGEFMGLIAGEYEARTDGGFRPGGASMHNSFAGHGPDADTHHKASVANLVPERVGDGVLAFVIECSMLMGITEWGMNGCQKRQKI